MLEPKELLQINATIIAGILILLAIIGSGEFVPFSEKIRDFNYKSEQFEKGINELDKHLQPITVKTSEINNRTNNLLNLTKSWNEEMRMLEIEFGPNFTQKDFSAYEPDIQNKVKQTLEQGMVLKKMAEELYNDNEEFLVMYNQTNPLIVETLQGLKDENEQLRLYSEEIMREYKFLGTPDQWVFSSGTNFGLSAVLAVFSAILKSGFSLKIGKACLVGSHAAMVVGFIYLTVIFFTVFFP